MRHILLLFLLLFAFVGFGQNTFYKLFSDQGADFGQGVVQLEDSSYMITGSSSSYYDGPSQAFLLKLDKQGNFEWSKDFGGSESEMGRRVLYKQNVGFFICGLTNSIGNGGYDFYLAKVNPNANLVWEKTYGGSGWERINDAIMTADTGAILVGSTNSNETSHDDIFIVRTNSNGDTLWTKTIGGSGDDYGTSITSLNDSTYIVGGTIFNQDSLMTKGFVMSLGDDGTEYWKTEAGLNGSFKLNSVCYVNNQLICAGASIGVDMDHDACYFLVDLNGNAFYNYSVLGFTGDEEYAAITTFNDSTNIYMVNQYDNDWSAPVGTDLNIARFVLPVNIQQPSVFIVNNENHDVPGQLISTLDGGVMMVGYSTGASAGGNEVLALKLGPNDSLPVPFSVTESLVFTEEIDALGNVYFYPNPANSQLTIHCENSNFTDYRLINALGQTVMKAPFSSKTTVDLQGLSNGHYILEVSGVEISAVRSKIIIQH